LRPDLDAVEVLSTEREALWARVQSSDFLTINEKRAAAGYAPSTAAMRFPSRRRLGHVGRAPPSC
jgi:phage portal protein BeeE